MFVKHPADFRDHIHSHDRNHGIGGNLSGDNGGGDVGGDDNDRYACMSVSGLRHKLHKFSAVEKKHLPAINKPPDVQ